MKKIHYSDRGAIAQKYETAMAGALNDAGWRAVRSLLMTHFPDFTHTTLPLHHKDVLTADFAKLAKIYVLYVKNDVRGKKPKIHNRIKALFNYDFEKVPNPHSTEIRTFFYENSEDFGLSTCHYCDMTYVNIYGVEESETGVLSFLNTASAKALKKVLGNEDSSIHRITQVRRSKRFVSKADYDSRVKYKRISFDKLSAKIKANNKDHTHFDLDHFLDKARCPIVALSLFNLVPSCTICNQRIKHSDVLGDLDESQLCNYSPTSEAYSFETDVKLKVSMEPRVTFLDYVKNKDKCRLEFECTGTKHYEREVEFFRLKERYNFHRIEALRLMDLRQRYDRGVNIAEIARLMYGSAIKKHTDQVRDDIFQTYFKQEYSRTFSKLYKDILS